jgi:hypothetical protein
MLLDAAMRDLSNNIWFMPLSYPQLTELPDLLLALRPPFLIKPLNATHCHPPLLQLILRAFPFLSLLLLLPCPARIPSLLLLIALLSPAVPLLLLLLPHPPSSPPISLLCLSVPSTHLRLVTAWASALSLLPASVPPGSPSTLVFLLSPSLCPSRILCIVYPLLSWSRQPSLSPS